MAHRTPKFLLKIRLDGPGIRSGSVPLPELIKICQIAQDAVNRQAESFRGKAMLTPGPKHKVVREECTLELFGTIGRGSSILPLRLAKSTQTLPGMLGIGMEAVQDVGKTLKEFSQPKNGHDIQAPAGVLSSIKELGDFIEGPKPKINVVEWIVPRFNGTPGFKAKFTPVAAERVRERMKQPIYRAEFAEGVLEMADTKANDHKCRIKPPLGTPINCTYRPEDVAKIISLMTCPVRVDGLARINAHSDKIEELAIEHIKPIDSLMVGAQDFFANKTLSVLARQQGVSPITDPEVLSGGLDESEDVDAFLEAIYQARN